MANEYRSVLTNDGTNDGTADSGAIVNALKNRQKLMTGTAEEQPYLNAKYKIKDDKSGYEIDSSYKPFSGTGGSGIDAWTTLDTKIFQGEGFGSKVIGDTVNKASNAGFARDKHSGETNKTLIEVNPFGFDSTNFDYKTINTGNFDKTNTVSATSGNSAVHADTFDADMAIITTTSNQLSYRNYTADETKDSFVTMPSAKQNTQNSGGTAASVVIEAGKNFNRGNDSTITGTTDVTDPNDPTKTVKASADINSSMVLDRSMFLNNTGVDVLSLRGGSGITFDKDGDKQWENSEGESVTKTT